LLVSPDGSRILHMSPVFVRNGEADGIWCLDAPFDQAPQVVPMPSGGDGVLVQGEGGWFALTNALHRPRQIEIRALRFDDVRAVRARTAWPSEAGPIGNAEAWRHIPEYWLASSESGSIAIRLSREGTLHPITLDWPRGDEGEEAPALVRCDPSTNDIVVGKYRSNEIVFCDAETGAVKQRIELEGNAYHVRDIQFHQASQTIWVVGYDMVFRFDQTTRKLERSKQVQPVVPYEHDPREKLRTWIGDCVLQPEQKRVCIARPSESDVIAVDWDTLAPVAVAKTGGKPAYLAAFGDLIIARDWLTGAVLQGVLS
jgi:hypothetical protein